MNLQQSLQPRSSANGFGRRRIDREIGAKAESKVHSGKSSQSNFDFTGKVWYFLYGFGLRIIF